MKTEEHAARQRLFYAERDHAHLRARQNDFYADKLAAGIVGFLGIQPSHRVLELGAGFGRFTFSLLEHCGSVVALDLSRRVLDELELEREARGIAVDRCRVVCADVDTVEADAIGAIGAIGEVDFAVGFFVLHHLADVAHALRTLRPVLAPGGAMAFLEPNRRNPLFLAQVFLSRDMTWQDERGMFRLSAATLGADFASAGLEPRPAETFGFFPPAIVNRTAAARRLESWLEARRWLRPVLPFLLVGADAPAAELASR